MVKNLLKNLVFFFMFLLAFVIFSVFSVNCYFFNDYRQLNNSGSVWGIFKYKDHVFEDPNTTNERIVCGYFMNQTRAKELYDGLISMMEVR